MNMSMLTDQLNDKNNDLEMHDETSPHRFGADSTSFMSVELHVTEHSTRQEHDLELLPYLATPSSTILPKPVLDFR
jgi:hypothetical protein